MGALFNKNQKYPNTFETKPFFTFNYPEKLFIND